MAGDAPATRLAPASRRVASTATPGTQGEHKLARGFAPRRLRSLHHIADPGLRAAIARFCAEERVHVDAYRRAAEQALPFRA